MINALEGVRLGRSLALPDFNGLSGEPRFIRVDEALVPCQGLVTGCVITKRPPLSDFAFR